MARFGRMFALGSGDGKTVPTKTSPSSLQKLWRTLSAEKKRVPLRFFTYPVKSTRVLFKEIELWERCKTTVICGMKSMTNTANVENAGSINNPPGYFTNTCLLQKLSGAITSSSFGIEIRVPRVLGKFTLSMLRWQPFAACLGLKTDRKGHNRFAVGALLVDAKR